MKKKAETKDAPKKESKPEAVSNIPFMKQMLVDKKDDAAIQKAFTKRYSDKGITDKSFIAKRIKIYKNIATKEIAAKA